MEPPLVSTKRTIKRIAPLSIGKVAALVYGIMGLIFIPFILLASAFNPMPVPQRAGFLAMGVGFAVVAPIFYAVMGFVLGVISGFLYNLVAKWVGGIEVEVT